MIARWWHGRTAKEKADDYTEVVRRTGLVGFRETPGNRGAFIFRSVEADAAHFWVLSLWDSMEAIRAFAGPEPEKAVYYPEDDEFLLEREPHVRHMEVTATLES